MKIIFMGTPTFAVPVFNALGEYGTVCAALTQPDRPTGRGMKVAYSPVKQAALDAGVTVLQPPTLRDKAVRMQLAAYEADIFIVAAYGLIIPPRVLAIPPLGCVNVHASLLPKYRGASPIHRAIMNGDAVTGISIMYMDKGIDTGDVILQRELPIRPGERFPELQERMAALGAACMAEALPLIAKGDAPRMLQDDTLATYAPMIDKADGEIDWNRPGHEIANLVRAFDPWPGAYTACNGQTLKIWQCEAEPETEARQPGVILKTDNKRGILVKAAEGGVWLTQVQATGKKRMAASDYLRGHPIRAGEIMGNAFR
jgi:methionyl-tRNA formyltransferase